MANEELRQSRARVRSASASLTAAIANARIELRATGETADQTWELLELLADQLTEALADLERRERHAGIR